MTTLEGMGIPPEPRDLRLIIVDGLHAAATAPDEAHAAIALELEHEVTAKIHEGLAVYFDQSDGLVKWQDADLAGMFAEEARKHRRIALGLDPEPEPSPAEVAADVDAFARRIQAGEFPGVEIAPQAAADAAERAAYYRDRDEVVGYPPYSGGPTTE